MYLRRMLAATAVVAFFGLSTTSAWAQSATLTLLHINDVYEISPKDGKGGIAELMTLLEAERNRVKHHLTIFGGDLISPSVMSSLTKGAQMIEMMNAINLDVAGLGNHEFDFGDEVLRQRMAASNFTWLASNAFGPDGRPFGDAQTSMIHKVEEFSVGMFALLTPETTHLSSPGIEVAFTPIGPTATAAVNALKEVGADLVIAITHLSLAEDRELARTVKGIDVILGGHDHDPITVYEGSTLILKAGHDAHYLVVAELAINKKDGLHGPKVTVLPQWRYLSTAGVTPHAGLAALVKKYEAALDAKLDVAIGRTTVELDSRRSALRSSKSNFGNLVADALRQGVKADVAIINSGGIRGDKVYPPGSELTRKDILSELPFGNHAVLLDLSGAELLKTLENGVSRVEDEVGRFPQISGMRFRFDATKPAGNRIVEVNIGGKPLNPNKRYKVATNEYIANGGDGYAVLKDAKTLIDAAGGVLMATTVMDYITAKNKIAPKIEGRVTQQ
ncbi:MAG: bifunctional metallophosphatase/5'-nucleotidase [Alphaproteobacteria bacterium]|nr:bifunctional metallophosphatase/5'-nucleotidase [Alphaproteobacteria bacterium]NKC02290.1 bifunctional metallophosphatase/5'-nucleotidase [Pseudomonadales bacterium]